ncbi:hypothetical protein ES708_26141 [subsurface metagenome]
MQCRYWIAGNNSIVIIYFPIGFPGKVTFLISAIYIPVFCISYFGCRSGYFKIFRQGIDFFLGIYAQVFKQVILPCWVANSCCGLWFRIRNQIGYTITKLCNFIARM